MEILNLKNKDKGFFTIDALIAIMLLLLILSTIINIYQGRMQMAEGIRNRMKGKIISEKIAAGINTVYASEGKENIQLDLPENILGKDYSIQFDSEEREISIKVSGNQKSTKYSKSTIAPENVEIKNTLNPSRKIRIYWQNNEIKVSNT